MQTQITFATCFYVLKSKFDVSVYHQWMANFVSIVNNFNLVIFTDHNSASLIPITNNPRIKIVIKPIEQFYTYKFRDHWINNHANNILLNERTCWELNMLWSEKIHFVVEAQTHFTTNLYGWCDIGYFRNRINDTHTCALLEWPNPKKLNKLKSDKIYYACVNPSNLKQFAPLVKSNQLLPPEQNTIAGGFFMLHNSMLPLWHKIYYNMLDAFFQKNWLVKDDQQVILYCALKHPKCFILTTENKVTYDNWFMFQRFLQ